MFFNGLCVLLFRLARRVLLWLTVMTNETSTSVCDADQDLCDYDFNCPSNYACDMGCCVYVIR